VGTSILSIALKPSCVSVLLLHPDLDWIGHPPRVKGPRTSHLQRQIPSLGLYPLLSLNSDHATTFTNPTNTIISPPGGDAAAGLGLDPEYLKFWQSISSSAKRSHVTVSPGLELNNVGVLKLSDSYEL
jgi:hypothetical protein